LRFHDRNLPGQPDGTRCLPRGRHYYVENPDKAEEQWTLEQVANWRIAIHTWIVVTCAAHLSVWSARSLVAATPVPILAAAAAWTLLKKGEIKLYNGRMLWSAVRHRRFFVEEALTTLPWAAIYFLIGGVCAFPSSSSPVFLRSLQARVPFVR